MSQELATTSYALLGLLAFGDGLTGYELKQRADKTLRFYWVSPAMSQVYSELTRLEELALVTVSTQARGRRTIRRYHLTDAGSTALRQWLARPPAEFPTLKHPIALRLLMGHLIDPGVRRAMLDEYLRALARRRIELQAVRDSLGDEPAVRFPAMVADWGLDYYASERAMVSELRRRLEDA
ncbi:MAG: PadR family transcriptional regulator [Nocardioidaceae bacterium]